MEKLDWQKEYIDAQLEFLEMLKKEKKDKGSGGDEGIQPVDFEGMGADVSGLGDPVKDLGEELNSWSTKIDKARSSLQIFKDAFKGKSDFRKLSSAEQHFLQEDDPDAYKQYKQDESMYDLGTKAGEIWRSISGPIQKVSDLIKGVNTGTENFKKKIDGLKAGMEAAASSPFIQALQTIFDAAADNVEILDPLTRAFDSLNKSLERAKETFKGTGDHLNSMGITWQSVGQAIAVVAGTIIAVIAGVISIIINLVMVIVEFVVRIVGHIIESIAGFVSGFIQMFQGLWDIIVGLCTGNWQKVLEGIVKFVTGAYEMLHSGWTLMTKMVGDILEGAVGLIIRLFSDVIAFLLRLFGANDVADKVQAWADNAIGVIRNFLDGFYQKLDDLKGKIRGWVDSILGLLDKLKFLEFSFNANLNTNTTSGNTPGHASGGITVKNKPHLAWVGDGNEQEAIIPLSELPGLMESMYGSQQMAASGGIVLNINNPVVREERDIRQGRRCSCPARSA